MKIVIALAVVVLLVACGEPSSERTTSRVVEEQQAHYTTVQPIPFFDFSMDRDTLIQIYKAKNEARQTSTVVTSQGTGDLVFQCPSVGYGIPADTQLTNPVAPYRGAAGGISDGITVEQPEPNGLFSSKNTDATYVLCVMDNGDVVPIYTEQKVTTFPFKVAVDENGVITPTGGDATITIEVNPGVVGEPPSSPEE